MGKKEIKIGLDYHGTITRVPFPFNWFYRNIEYTFNLPSCIRWITWKLSVLIPEIEDECLLRSIPKDWNVIVISGSMKKKLRLVKKYKIDYFFDDQLYVVSYLRRKGIDAIDIRNVRKYL